MTLWRAGRGLTALLAVLGLGGCATLPNGRLAFLGVQRRPQQLGFSVAALPGGAALRVEYGF
jgi:hypothetical protein